MSIVSMLFGRKHEKRRRPQAVRIPVFGSSDFPPMEEPSVVHLGFPRKRDFFYEPFMEDGVLNEEYLRRLTELSNHPMWGG